ncbi:Minf_1886 family protein [Stieleria varia]|uniref:Uncharacterized protein n=1 Tax=Stieleria varia TaxID=2528005 RepID=A0A5C5ZZK6_9BACT|nr:Minf_1886 family protein [Stieleria varia]TWT91773.1 hypothetical protein Pla52n_65230 [Stieleria varia]
MTSALQVMRKLLKDDPRYKPEAYQFIREALHFAQENLSELNQAEYVVRPSEEDGPRHITGQQLCEACRLYAIEQFGFLAGMVLAKWGVHSTGDFGEMVYNLIRIDQMRKSDSDRREDFDDVYPFDNAFEPHFRVARAEEI